MVEVVGTKFLHEYREDTNRHFPEEELSKLKSAIETVNDDIFIESGSGDEIKLDEKMASRLDKYASGQKTEYQLWEDSNHSVDLYNPDKRIAVEIEKTEQKNIWKDLIKFSRGSDDQIEYGCAILPENYRVSDRNHNIFRHAQRALKFTSPLMPVQDVVLIGYRDPRS